jgi:hypothetical protein
MLDSFSRSGRNQQNLNLGNRRMENSRKNRPLWRGVGYGCILSLVEFMAIGDDHGTCVPAGLFTAPLGFAYSLNAVVPIGIVALLVRPLLWGVIYSLANSQSIKRGPYIATGILLVHYACAIILLGPAASEMNDFSDWKHLKVTLNSVPGIIFLVVCACTYILVQAQGIREVLKGISISKGLVPING